MSPIQWIRGRTKMKEIKNTILKSKWHWAGYIKQASSQQNGQENPQNGNDGARKGI